ncbi:hypothetical protein J3R83DRAFT_2431 [Lanmaoa asiatica]|nr:hypothetical protein J3R83DRAFT_2431 [Lanmaoa asiatica]
MPTGCSSPEKKQKPHFQHAPYKPHQPKPLCNKNAPRTLARSTEPVKRKNLTLHDWHTVFNFIDKHSEPGAAGISQDAVVEHFKTLPDPHKLFFDQSTLCQKLRSCTQLEACAQEYPSTLSYKRICVVTSPVVNQACN